jgi:hypothetical protein
MRITTPRDVRTELETNAYSLIPASEIDLPPNLLLAWEAMRAQYPALPLDEFLPGGLKYRFRRWGKVYYLPSTGEIIPLPASDYFQSADINTVTGGIIRRFAPLPPETFENPFVQALIRFNMDQFPVSLDQRSQPWQVDIHQIRVVADATGAGHPTPEGIHKDGAEFVTVHLVEFENATGAEVTIYDNDKTPVQRFQLANLLDSYLFEDPRVWHAASPITPVDPQQAAVRSILTFDYHFAPALERPRTAQG